MATDIGNMMQQVLNAQAQSAAEQAAANERTANLMQNMVQGLSAMVEQMTKQGATQEPQVQKPKFESLGGKVLEKVKKFTGGEEEWTDWSDDMRMIVDMQSLTLSKLMKHVESHGEKSVDQAVKDLVEDDVEEYQHNYTDAKRLSHELYRWLVLATEGEAKLLVKSSGDHDGVAAWGRMHAKFKRRTITRLMRMISACMYPKEAKVETMATALLQWEERWKKLLAEFPDIRIPDLLKMAALHALCPKEIKEILDLQWDEIGEDYQKMRGKVVAWATNRAEKKNGPVPMEIGQVISNEEQLRQQY